MLHVIILAAGQGKRMRSALPKVLHQIAGQPMLAHIIDAARSLAPASITVVDGHGGAAVRAAFEPQPDLRFVRQAEQRGTGHAVAQALPGLPESGQALVLFGDVPLVRSATLAQLRAQAEQHAVPLTLLTTRVSNPQGYGRIVRTPEGQVCRIVEQTDATEAEQAIDEINTGLLLADLAALRRWLERIQPNNQQGEYYLTDIVALAAAEGQQVSASVVPDATEVAGINSRAQQAQAERVWQQRSAQQLLDAGVTLLDPARLDVRGNLTCGNDVSIDVGCVFIGEVRLGNHVRIGPYCTLQDTQVDDHAEIHPYSHLQQAHVGAHAKVGPYARLRPGAVLGTHSQVGNFVELKHTQLGDYSKANHLSYLGDATIGTHVNIGAGVITCNYDGMAKHHTHIGDHAFIGSDSQLIAPVSVGAGATLGAGTTLTRDAPAQALTLSRLPQTTVTGWQRGAKTNLKPDPKPDPDPDLDPSTE